MIYKIIKWVEIKKNVRYFLIKLTYGEQKVKNNAKAHWNFKCCETLWDSIDGNHQSLGCVLFMIFCIWNDERKFTRWGSGEEVKGGEAEVEAWEGEGGNRGGDGGGGWWMVRSWVPGWRVKQQERRLLRVFCERCVVALRNSCRPVAVEWWRGPKLHQGGEFGSDDDCGNGGALIFQKVNDSRHLPKNPVLTLYLFINWKICCVTMPTGWKLKCFLTSTS